MPNTLDGYERLVAAVIASGLDAAGTGYLQGNCGRWWIGVGGLDPEAVWREYHTRNFTRTPPYHIARCRCALDRGKAQVREAVLT